MSKELKFIEEWKSCPGYECSYEVSNFGNVRSIDRTCGSRPGVTKGKLLKPFINRHKYLEVNLFENSKSTPKIIHRLVAKAFIPNPESKPQVNHIDGNKLNNRVDNLEWMSNSENQKHAYSLGLQPSRAGENNSKAKITDKDVTLLKELYNSGKSVVEISKLTEISVSSARQIIYGRTWKSNTTPIIRRDDRTKPTTKYEKGTEIYSSPA
ncbi:MAG: hypothetical protein EB127_01275 [Alphaproteobacteria bacterium]|nr:hypothetical protein [Alphaproteobacteria bacterium]